MSQRAKELAERFTALNDEMILFIEKCSDEDWKKICSGEEWTVGVVAHHIAAGHYFGYDLAKIIVAGEALPEITMEALDQMNAQHAKDHADCTKEEVTGMMREKGSSIAEFIAGLNDEDLARTAHFSLIGGDIGAQQLIENIIIPNCTEHLTNMKAAIGG